MYMKRTTNLRDFMKTIKGKWKKLMRKANKNRKPSIFQLGDLVWMHLREDKFPSKRKSKVAPRVDGPFIVIAKITDNASTLDFSGDFG